MPTFEWTNRRRAQAVLIFTIFFVSATISRADALPADKSVTLLRMAPSGDTPESPAEIVFQFDKQVVPLGRMERTAQEVPISFSPPLTCEWRWQNPSALACILNERARPRISTTYTATVPLRFDTTAPFTLSSPFTASFTTPRPAVSAAWVRTWGSPTIPVVHVVTNQSVQQTTLAAHLYFEDQKRVRYPVVAAEVTPEPNERQGTTSDRSDAGRRWDVTPQVALPADATLDLKISRGMTGTEGSEAGLEERSLISIHTFGDFDFIGMTCRDSRGEPFLIRPGQKGVGKRCDPLNAIQLTFNAPISKERITSAIRSQPDLRGGRGDFDPWESSPSYPQLDGNHLKNQTYFLNLPYGLKADTRYTFSAEALGIRDEFDRPLSNDLEVSFSTDNRLPRFVLDHRHSVLEKETDSKLPVVVNNIDSLTVRYQALTADTYRSNLTTVLTPFKASNVAYPFPLDIRGLLGGRSGVIQGSVSGKPPQKYDNTQRFFAQVTPFAVHAKIGHFNSLIWVTSLSTGDRIADAQVSLLLNTITQLAPDAAAIARSNTDQNGLATLPGAAVLDPKLDYIDQWDETKPRLFVRVEKDGDVALVPLSWDYQVYDNEVYPYTRPSYGHIHTWGTTAQGIYRLGDKVQFALWVRDQNNERLVPAPREGYSLEVKDPTDKIVFQVPNITLSEFGSYAGDFTTSPTAAVGWYTFTLKSSFSRDSWEPLRVLISDFTPAPFAVTNEIQTAVVRAGDRASLRTEARLHAGGPYADAPARITARLVSAPLGLQSPALQDFVFSVPDVDHVLFQGEDRIDTKGDLLSTLELVGSDLVHGNLLVESAVRDDRGKFVTAHAKARYIGRDRFVGVAQGDWVLSSGKSTVVKALVIDENGDRVQGTKIQLQVEYEDTKVARVKSAGNVYTNRYETSWVTIKSCEVTSGIEPTPCEFTPTKPGRYRCSATIQDSRGREHKSTLDRWSTGSGELVWQTSANNHLQIIPERDTYRIGETARFMIQNPFPTAQALLTVERYGIQRSWTQMINEPSTIIEVPITHDHIPGFFLSATLMSPRVSQPIEGNVDLGKPTFRMGYVQITVDDPAKKLSLSISTPKPSYKPGEEVTLTLGVSPQTPHASELEFAVTVIDEAVFDLIASRQRYFDPYRGFYSLDGLDVRNYNLLKMLLGRQQFEKKGANPGGDGGGKLDMRSIQRYVSYWNPAIRADGNGQATVSFKAPENLTGWKVLALAFTKEDRMGLSEGRFVVNKETEVRSALPNQVRRGDTFSAIFTVMNRTDKPRTLTIETSSEGDSVTAAPQKLSLVAEPFKRYPVAVTATAVKDGIAYLILRASDALDGDALRVALPVLPKTTITTAASFGSSQSEPVEQSVQIPTDIDPLQGSIGAVISTSLLGGLDGAFAYMRDYPYECWEQKLSKAVVAAFSIKLRRYLPQSFNWPDAEELVLQTLRSASQHQAPNGGMSFYAPSDAYVSHYLSGFTALAFTWLEDLGYPIPDAVRANLSRYLDGILRNDTFDPSWSSGEKTTARALVLAALARAPKTTPTPGNQSIAVSDLRRLSSRLHDMGVFGKALYLQAAVALGEAAQPGREEALRQLLAAGSEVNSTYTFQESAQRLSPWLLDSRMRSQCTALEALIKAHLASPTAKRQSLEPRIEKLARTLMLERKRQDRWENTQENLFCLRALSQYAEHHEGSTAPITIDAAVGVQKLATLTLKPGSSEPVEASRPLTSADAGSATKVTLTPTDTGRFYYSTRLSYAPREPRGSATNAGIEVSREYSVQRGGSWTALESPMQIRRGDLVAVNLFVRIPQPRYFVVINDPIPGGLEPVNRELGTSSTTDTEQRGFVGASTSLWFTTPKWITFAESRWSFYHRELRHTAARFYSDFLEAGNYHLSYVTQAIAPGEFVAPATHAEAMYDPDIFGESTSVTLKVE